MVLVLSNDTPRDQWSLEHITKMILGLDGRMRVLNVQVEEAELKRSMHKLVPLECDGQIDKSKIDQGWEKF